MAKISAHASSLKGEGSVMDPYSVYESIHKNMDKMEVKRCKIYDINSQFGNTT